MQILGILLIVASTAWLGVDASKRDWSDSKVAKNVPTWIVGSLLLWILIFPLYFFVERKKAPLLEKKAENKPKPKPAPAPVAAASVPAPPLPVAALEASGPAEAMGPSVEEVEEAPVFEPLAAAEPEPVIEIAPEPVVEIEAFEPEPIVEIEPFEPEPVVEVEPIVAQEPEPVVEIEAEPTVEIEADSSVGVDWAALAAADHELALDEPEPDEPTVQLQDEPAGLSFDAFKDIKPVSFGAAEPDPEPEAAAEPVVEPEPSVEPEPTVAFEPEPVIAFEPEPVVAFEAEPEPIAVLEPEPEPAPKKKGSKLNPEIKLPSFGRKKSKPLAPGPLTDDELVMLEVLTEMGPLSAQEIRGELKGGTLEEIEAVLHSLTRRQRAQGTPHPAGGGLRYSVAAEEQPKPAKEKKSRSGKFNPKLKLPSFSRKEKEAGSGSKKSFLNLPEHLQGPLNDIERKIVLGSVVAIVAAAGLGYKTARKDDQAAVPPPAPAPAAATR